MKQMMLYIGDIALFLNKNEDIGPAIRSKLFGVLSNSQKNACLRVELAAVVDWGEPLNFVKACYFLEEDGPLATECYEAIERIRSGLHTEHIPNGRAVTQRLSGKAATDPAHEAWVLYVVLNQVWTTLNAS